MSGIDELERPGPEVDASDQSRGEVVSTDSGGVAAQRGVRFLHGFDQVGADTSAPAETRDAHCGGEGGANPMAHGLCQRQVKDVSRKAVVKGVAADAGSRFKPTSQGEGRGFTRTGEQKQARRSLISEPESI